MHYKNYNILAEFNRIVECSFDVSDDLEQIEQIYIENEGHIDMKGATNFNIYKPDGQYAGHTHTLKQAMGFIDGLAG